ncbi:hypothetical protein NQ176_g9830 [Zarea fungicola]|uniref:Uncharacterized protein n=1 Tax=Zarea fungicola TaxID=93591 RepID=A0ACC1ML92_9HYPO|nr:hypothetical protein NQ176_g9830 [Lecanicillium fungicola]
MRYSVLRASENILEQLNTDTPAGHPITSEALTSVAWLLGEYSDMLFVPEDTMNGLLQLTARTAKADVGAVVVHAIAKVFASMTGNETESWTAEKKSRTSLLLSRILHSIEPLTLNPHLEVQERAVEFTELLKLAAEATSGQPASTDNESQDPPLLLTQAIPSLFNGIELNSVAAAAQLNVPMPDGLDLDEPIHHDLNNLLAASNINTLDGERSDDFEIYYYQRLSPTSVASFTPAISLLAEPDETVGGSYQQLTEDSYLDADIIARRKAERVERNKDDPFYIGSEAVSEMSTSIHNILQTSNGPDLDIDAIPIMKLDLDNLKASARTAAQRSSPAIQRQRVVIAADETLQGSNGSLGNYDSENNSEFLTRFKARTAKQSLLQVDSSTIGSFNLEGEPNYGLDHERQRREELELQQAMKEVERLRLEMQRAKERIQVVQGVDVDGAVVKKKKTKKKTLGAIPGNEESTGVALVKRKKSKVPKEVTTKDGSVEQGVDTTTLNVIAPKKKHKKKKKPVAELGPSDT